MSVTLLREFIYARFSGLSQNGQGSRQECEILVHGERQAEKEKVQPEKRYVPSHGQKGS